MTFALITGARGFIGRHLSRRLANNNYQVVGIGHGMWSDADKWGTSYWLDAEVTIHSLRQMQQIHGLPEVVFHLAGGSSVGTAIADPLNDFSRTVQSTAELLEWLRQHSPNTQLLAASSAAVYGTAYSEPIIEDAQTSPLSPYGTHKLMMEELCQSYAANYGLKVILPRIFSVYGEELRKQLLWDLCGKMADEGPIELGGSGNEIRDWIHVSDVVRALVQLSQHASMMAPIVNLATGTGTAVRDIAALVSECWVHQNSSNRVITFSGQSRPGDPFSLIADTTLMHTYGINNNIDLKKSIPEYVSWYKAQIGVID